MSLTACGGGSSGGQVVVNPLGADALSFEKDGGVLTSITIEENSVVSVRLVITGQVDNLDAYIFTVTSDNHTLLPPKNIEITGSGKFRDLVITPSPSKTGTANLTGHADNAVDDISINVSLKVIVIASEPEEETDSDLDGVVDYNDAFPTNSAASIDNDEDGFPDSWNASCNLSCQGASGLVLDNYLNDSDNDGAINSEDSFPLDPNETIDTDSDGIGNNADADDDNDGVLDNVDAFPLDVNEYVDTDSDGTGNNADTDDDNDGALDGDDAFPLDASEQIDTDNDGIGNNTDLDDDGDGWSDLDEGQCSTNALNNLSIPVDTDLDGICDAVDTDDDNDGTLDGEDAFPLDASESIDTDSDGVGNNVDTDDDGDGYSDSDEIDNGTDPLLSGDTPDDFDGDFISDLNDDNDDNDSALDSEDAFPFDPSETIDTDLDGIGNNADTDDDNDGVLDAEDAFPFDATEDTDTDSDGVGNNTDLDDDGDGTLDTVDAFPLDPNEDKDTDSDGVGDNADAFPTDPTETTDTDSDGVGDNEDLFPNDLMKALPLNDTGSTLCGDYAYTDSGTSADVNGSGTHNNNVNCASVNATQSLDGTEVVNGLDIVRAGQDATYGRDVSESSDVDGHAGFSFTKLDSDGVALADQTLSYATQPWSCVEDNVTGLTWEVKTNDNGLHDKDFTYTWFNSTGVNDGGDHGIGDMGVGSTTGYENPFGGPYIGSDNCTNTSRCDTEKYIADVNASNGGLGLCGYSDWYLPNKEVLTSLVTYDRTNPAIDTDYFPNTQGNYYWVSSSLADGLGQKAWTVFFVDGGAAMPSKTSAYFIRLVRRTKD